MRIVEVAELPGDWCYVETLAGGGMAVWSPGAQGVVLLDRELNPTATVQVADPVGRISVSEPAGLVAVCRTTCVDVHVTTTGVDVYDLTGRRVYGTEHEPLQGWSDCAWTNSGAQLWTVAPDAAGGTDVVVVDTTTWTVVARYPLGRQSRWQIACYTLLADPVAAVVAAQGVITNRDGTFGACLRLAGGTLGPIDNGLLARGSLLEDVRPDGGEFVLNFESGLFCYDWRARRVTAALDLRNLAGTQPAAPEAGPLSEARIRQTHYLSADLLAATTDEGQMLVLDRDPLRFGVQLSLFGPDARPFSVWDVWVPEYNRWTVPYFHPWRDGRIVVEKCDGRECIYAVSHH